MSKCHQFHLFDVNHLLSVFLLELVRHLLFSLPFPFHWVGDAAYVDSPSMMTPYPGIKLHETNPPKDWFNFWQSQLRITIERTFGIFIGRWGILWKPLRFNLKNTIKILETLCRLHNFAINRGIPILNRGDPPPNTNVNENGVLVEDDWRDVHPFENLAGESRTGSTLKDYILGLIIEQHSSHRRTI